MKVGDWLAQTAAAVPERTAVVCGEERLSYLDLDARVGQLAAGLAEAGVGEGDVVATTLAAGTELVCLLHAAIRVGAALGPVDPSLPGDERRKQLEGLGAKLTIDRAAQTDELTAARPLAGSELELSRALCVIHTSGSAGAPKPVALSGENHLWSAVGCGLRIDHKPSDHWLCCLPMHHIGALAIAVRSVIYRSTIVIERFDAQATASTIASGEVTLVSLVATMLDRLLAAGARPGNLRCALLGGGPAPPELVERALAAGIPVAPTYGMTETCSQVTTLLPEEWRERPGSAGCPIPSTQVRVDDDGRIYVRGKTVAPGMASDGGWLCTSDLGHLDSEGYLYVIGRADRVIVTGGENVSPEEVEAVLLSHTDVTDAAVYGRDDPEWQQAVIAAVVGRGGAQLDPAALAAHCRERLPAYKVPKKFQLVDSLPRNEQGKLLRERLSLAREELPRRPEHA